MERKYKLSLHVVSLLLGFLILLSCKTRQHTITKPEYSRSDILSRQLDSIIGTNQSFTGIVFKNMDTDKYIYTKNADKYFTPASNTKIFTLLASISILGDSIPALQYVKADSAIHIQGTGDPSFLTEHDRDSTAYQFIQQLDDGLIYLVKEDIPRFGAGWAWDDYSFAYQKEVTSFPVFGNSIVLEIDSLEDIAVTPAMMEPFVSVDQDQSRAVTRNEFSNHIVVNVKHFMELPVKLEIPMYGMTDVLPDLLTSIFDGKTFEYSTRERASHLQTIYSNNANSLYRDLLLNSDNFVAEQLITLCASRLNIAKHNGKTIEHILHHKFTSLVDRVRWVDGSGLSRYNLFTPRSMVWALEELYAKLDPEDIRSWFPSPDHIGTLPIQLNVPGLYAKTGTLSNNFNLSGYIYTRSGERLVFSWMNNHYTNSKADIAAQMGKVLRFIFYNW